ncbi:hypothetical protein J2S48_005298 [Promicromonospora iranensis]|uniref:Pentapeptide repeat protein n=1 Tax=Promicromonospora iranensis TaxID=1105144 RepID=A0ABU2CWX2_9MICO|nr:hypothetical protein [Promicromonospora iranensis]
MTRPQVEDISSKDLRLRDVALNGAALKDVTIDGLAADGQSMLFDALQLEHVTLRGGNQELCRHRLRP